MDAPRSSRTRYASSQASVSTKVPPCGNAAPTRPPTGAFFCTVRVQKAAANISPGFEAGTPPVFFVGAPARVPWRPAKARLLLLARVLASLASLSYSIADKARREEALYVQTSPGSPFHSELHKPRARLLDHDRVITFRSRAHQTNF